VARERIERFLKNLVPALSECIAEDFEVLDTAIPALICVGALWFIGMAVLRFYS
jgi:hypothetical protein